MNLGAGYRLTPWMQLVAQVTNLFDRKYYTAGQLGPFGFTDTGSFIARPLPAINGEFPVRQATFYAPGAPARCGWARDSGSDPNFSSVRSFATHFECTMDTKVTMDTKELP